MIGIGKINLKKNLVGRDTFGLGILGESGYNHWRNGLEILIKRKVLKRKTHSILVGE